MARPKPFGILKANRAVITDAVRRIGVHAFGTYGYYRNYFNQNVFEQTQEWVLGTSSQVTNNDADVYYDDAAGLFKDKAGGTVTFLDHDRIAMIIDTADDDIDFPTDKYLTFVKYGEIDLDSNVLYTPEVASGELWVTNGTVNIAGQTDFLIINGDVTLIFSVKSGTLIHNGNLYVNGELDLYKGLATSSAGWATTTVPPNAIMFDGADLYLGFANPVNLVRKYFGISNSEDSNFATPSTAITGMTFDGTNLISCDNTTNLIYIHNGIAAAIGSSFAAPGTSPTGLTMMNGNLVSMDFTTGLVYIHDGITSSILDSFTPPGSGFLRGVVFDGKNLIIARDTGGIYVLDGASSSALKNIKYVATPAGVVASISQIELAEGKLLSCDTVGIVGLLVHG